MHRFSIRTILNLMPATRPIRHNNRITIRLPHRGQQIHLRHPHRNVIMVGLVAEGPRHPAAARFNGLDFQVRDQPEHGLHRPHGAEGLLVAVAVELGLFLVDGLERQLEIAFVVLAL